MSENKTTVSRREFLKDAGLVVGGATIGSAALLSACGEDTPTTPVAPKTEYVCPVDGKKFDSLDLLKAHYAEAHETKELASIVTLNINGKDYTLPVEPWWPLVFVLRDILGFFSVKVGCDLGNCGTCTILADGKPVFACLMLACECDGIKLQTLEGFADGGMEFDPVIQAFYDDDAYQCGYCTPGLIVAAEALVAKKANPTLEEVQEAFSGHLCFCANMTKQVECLVRGGIK